MVDSGSKDMFCQNCGSWLSKKFKFCPNCGITPTDSTENSKSINTFGEFKAMKTKERINQTSNKRRKMTDSVTINVGLATTAAGIFKPCRGKSLPLKVSKDASAEHLLGEALKKRAAYDRSFRNDLTYKLCYPDGTEVVYLPGGEEPFTLEKYKDDLGRNYNRINFFLWPLKEEEPEVIHSDVCVINDDDFADSDDEFDLQDSIFGDDAFSTNHPQSNEQSKSIVYP